MKLYISFFSILLALSAVANLPYQEGFESEALNSDIEAKDNWSGYGFIIEREEPSQELPVANPIPESEHEKELLVEGKVSCALPSTEVKDSYQTDMLVFASGNPDILPTGEEMSDVQIAVATGKAVENKVPLMLFCKPYKNNAFQETPEWVKIGDVDKDTYIRLNCEFDYLKGVARVSVNGEPCVSEFGRLTSDMTTYKGSWYRLNDRTTAADKIVSISFEGLHKIEDLVVRAEALADYNPFKPENDEIEEDEKSFVIMESGEPQTDAPWAKVKPSDLFDWGLTAEALSEMIQAEYSASQSGEIDNGSIQKKLEAGYAPNSEDEFEPISVTMSEEETGETTKHYLKFQIPTPTFNAISQGVGHLYYQLMFFDQPNAIMPSATRYATISGTSSAGATSELSFVIPSDKTGDNVIFSYLSACRAASETLERGCDYALYGNNGARRKIYEYSEDGSFIEFEYKYTTATQFSANYRCVYDAEGNCSWQQKSGSKWNDCEEPEIEFYN